MRAHLKAGKSKSSLFLIELMLAILFFSIASAACVQVFAKAHLLSTRSASLSAALREAQTAAECFKAQPRDEDALAGLMGAQRQPAGLVVYYGPGFERAQQEGAAYSLTLRLSAEGDLSRAHIEVAEAGGGTIYTLEAAQYTPG